MTRAAGTETRPRKRIGKYVLTGRIGKGGMGRVYCGYDEALEREVAVKTLSYEGSQDDDHRRRFSIEAKAAARLQHPNIVTVYELGEDRGVPFIAMELLAGVDLEALLRSGDPLLLHEALDVMVQVCRGLHFAHERGIVHRDMKPSNIRVLDDGTAKIMDFGIAKLGASGITKSGMMVGTIHYMSPEQIRGQQLDGRCDVFAMGVILYELLARRRPFQGEAATEILYKIVHEEPPPLPIEELGEAGAVLRDIVSRALAKDPAQRWPSAAALGDELARVLEARRREGALEGPSDLPDSVKQARALVLQDRVDEGLARLRALTELHPQALGPRRALRWATGEARRRQGPATSEHDDFPELEATFQSAPTHLGQDGAAPPTTPAGDVLPPAEEPPTRLVAQMQPTVLASRTSLTRLLPQQVQQVVSGRPLLAVGGGALLLALGLGAYFASTAGDARPSPSPSASATASPTPAVRTVVEVNVRSEPDGARVTVDGETLEGVTPLTVALDPAREHRIRVALAGHATKEIQVAAGQAPPELRVPLEPSGPLGRVTLVSAYPVDVQWKGRSLAKEQTSAVLSLPAGRQTVTLLAPDHLLRVNVTVDVPPGGEASLVAPALGRINVRANPDNCKVYIDGTFIDYPPILDRPLAAGTHTVAFVWPDGQRREETVEVGTAGPSYVMGRRE